MQTTRDEFFELMRSTAQSMARGVSLNSVDFAYSQVHFDDLDEEIYEYLRHVVEEVTNNNRTVRLCSIELFVHPDPGYYMCLAVCPYDTPEGVLTGWMPDAVLFQLGPYSTGLLVQDAETLEGLAIKQSKRRHYERQHELLSHAKDEYNWILVAWARPIEALIAVKTPCYEDAQAILLNEDYSYEVRLVAAAAALGMDWLPGLKRVPRTPPQQAKQSD